MCSKDTAMKYMWFIRIFCLCQKQRAIQDLLDASLNSNKASGDPMFRNFLSENNDDALNDE